MYAKEGRKGILWEFHRSGLDMRSAYRALPLFPNADNLYRWLRTGCAGELETREMPDKLARMHCPHGEDGPAYTDRRP